MSKFIAYLPAGYPDIDTSVEALETLIDAGADIIEIGIPYSDPVMDGKEIQKASNIALNNGFKVKDVWGIIHRLQVHIDRKIRSGQLFYTPQIYIMTYYNIVLQYGIREFCEAAHAERVSGLIIPDLIPDEAAELRFYARNYRLNNVHLAAINSSDERLDILTKSASGFVYSSLILGTTGVRQADGGDFAYQAENAAKMIERIKQAQVRTMNFIPIYVGIGVSNPRQAGAIAEVADGVIVGSKLVQALGEGLSTLYSEAKSLADAIK